MSGSSSNDIRAAHGLVAWGWQQERRQITLSTMTDDEKKRRMVSSSLSWAMMEEGGDLPILSLQYREVPIHIDFLPIPAATAAAPTEEGSFTVSEGRN